MNCNFSCWLLKNREFVEYYVEIENKTDVSFKGALVLTDIFIYDNEIRIDVYVTEMNTMILVFTRNYDNVAIDWKIANSPYELFEMIFPYDEIKRMFKFLGIPEDLYSIKLL